MNDDGKIEVAQLKVVLKAIPDDLPPVGLFRILVDESSFEQLG